MNLEDKKKEVSWYDNANFVTNLILVVLALILISSQSLGGSSDLTAWDLFKNVINVNILYVLVLVYFILLKFKLGKRYFNHLNVLLILLYFIIFITSFLSIFKAFDLIPFLKLLIYLFIFIQAFHTFFRDTRFWKEFKLNNSPFNEISGESHFYIISIISIIYLALNLIMTDEFSGVVLTLFVTIFYILFSRYIMLYDRYLDEHDKDNDNLGNFDKFRDAIGENLNKEKIQGTIKDVGESLDKTGEKIADVSKKAVKKVKNIDKNEIKKNLKKSKDDFIKRMNTGLEEDDSKSSNSKKKGDK